MPQMPDPWFRASSSGRRIGAALSDDTLRAARPGERALLSFILPPFQRPAVWTEQQKVTLIESIWEGIPTGSYVINRVRDPANPCADWLLDGQQRWTSIRDYVAEEFEVFGVRFPDLDRVERSDFGHRTLTEVTTQLEDPAACLRVYNRLAYGGTAHDPLPEAEGPTGPRP